MDKVARLPNAQRSELFSETAARMGVTPAVVEKDFWVTWVLDRLFASPELARLLMFKGGTSLSNAYRLIERFSEDIDLILDWRVLNSDDPLAERSKAQQERLNEAINAQAQNYIGGELLARVKAQLAGVCRCAIEREDPHVINVRYPGAFADDYTVAGSPAGNRAAGRVAAARGAGNQLLCRRVVSERIRTARVFGKSNHGGADVLGKGDDPAS